MISIVLEGEKLKKIKKHFGKHWGKYLKGGAAVGAGIGAYSLAKDLPYRHKAYSDQKWDTDKTKTAHDKLTQTVGVSDKKVADSAKDLLFKQQNKKILQSERDEKLYGTLGSGAASAILLKSLLKKKKKEANDD